MNTLNPFFSIIIPTYNRPDRLTQCLNAISKLDYPSDFFEVIVVDDGSETSLDSITNLYQQNLQLTLIKQKNSGPAKARNTGANIAKGQYLVFTDDDCQPDSKWLNEFKNGFLQNSNALLGGKTLNALTDNIYSTTSQLLIDYLYDYYNQHSNKVQFFASNNFALSKELFNQVGQFDTSFPLAAGEDREFCDRWLFFSYSLDYVPEAIIHHSHHLSLSKFWRQHFNYGRGAFYFHKIRSGRLEKSIKVEPFTFYFNLLSYPFYQTNIFHSSKIFLSILLFIAQFANALGFLKMKGFR